MEMKINSFEADRYFSGDLFLYIMEVFLDTL